jgi:hypothetical protein
VKLAIAALRGTYGLLPPAVRWLPAYQHAAGKLDGTKPGRWAGLVDRGLVRLVQGAAGR